MLRYSNKLNAFLSILTAICQFSNIGSACNSTGELINRVYVVRHGERAPDITFPTYVYHQGINTPGRLTPRGRFQMERLGKEISRNSILAPAIKIKSQIRCMRWWCSNPSLARPAESELLSPPPYNIGNFFYANHENVRITASNVTRCRESANVLAAKIFNQSNPPLTDSTVQNLNPAVTIATTNLLLSGSVKCSALVQYIAKEFVPKHTLFREMLTSNRDFINYVFTQAGLTVPTNTFPIFMVPIANTLAADKLLNNPLPVWVNDTVYEKIQSLANFFYTNLGGRGDEIILKHSSGLLAQNILRDFQRNVELVKRFDGRQECLTTLLQAENDPRKLSIYVGHDHTLIHFLSLLNYSTNHIPGFGATLIIDLWTEPQHNVSSMTTIESLLLVRVAYKNYEGGLYKPIIERMPYVDLVNWLSPRIPRDETDAKAFCESSSPTKDDLNLEPS